MLTDHAILSKMATLGPRCRLYDPAALGRLHVEIAPARGVMTAHFRVPVITERGTHSMRSIGRYPEMSIDAARAIALQAKAGLFPDGAHARARARRRSFFDIVKGGSFESSALEYLASLSGISQDTIDLHTSRLRRYVFPRIGHLPASEVSMKDLKEVLVHVASVSADMAYRLRSLLNSIFEYLRFHERVVVNPTPSMKFISSRPPVKHHIATLDPFEFGGVYRSILAAPASPQRDLFLLLPHLMCRTGELRTLMWSSVDMRRMTVRIDVSKCRSEPRELLIPMSRQVFALFSEIERRGEYVFESLIKPGYPINKSTASHYLSRDLSISEQSAHGFRASARTMLAEHLGYEGVVPEIALGHTVQLPTGSAYHRAIYLDARMKMMQDWSDFIEKHSS